MDYCYRCMSPVDTVFDASGEHCATCGDDITNTPYDPDDEDF